MQILQQAGWGRPATQGEGPVPGLPAEPFWSAPLASALLPQGRLVWGGSGCGGCSGCSLFLPLPQGGGLLLLLCVALHVGTAALHLVKHPAARQEGSSKRSVPTSWDHKVWVCVFICVERGGGPSRLTPHHMAHPYPPTTGGTGSHSVPPCFF